MKKSGVAVILFLCASVCSGVTLEVVPSSQRVDVGETLTVDVNIWGLGEFAAPSLGAFDVTLSFDPAVLGFADITFGPYLGDEAAGEAITGFSVSDDLMAFEVSLLLPEELIGLQPAGFTLFTVTFEGLTTGGSPLVIAADVLADELGDPIIASTIDSYVAVGRVNVLEIPTVSEWGLLLLSLALLCAGVFHVRKLRTRRL